MGCVEACLDEDLALRLRDALGDHEGTWRTGEVIVRPGEAARRVSGSGRRLGDAEGRLQEWEDRGGDEAFVEVTRGWNLAVVKV